MPITMFNDIQFQRIINLYLSRFIFLIQFVSICSGPSGKYGLVEKIVDGMYISINSVLVSFAAPKFNASIQVLDYIAKKIV